MLEKQWWYNLTYNCEGGDKGYHTFPKSISQKVNVIAQLDFELTYYNVAVLHVNHYVSGIFLSKS